MIWKFLLTIALIGGGLAVLMARLRASDRPAAGVSAPLLTPGLARRIAYVVVALMLAGSGWYLYSGWAAGAALMRVAVVNANTGLITPYEARRRDIQGRVFRTLDGREIRLADVERVILEPAARPRLPTAGPAAPPAR